MKTVSEIQVEMTVKVGVDEAKFTDQFMAEFRTAFHDFRTLDEHREHLAQLFARGLISNDAFIEGYGQAADMGITFEMCKTEMHTWSTDPLEIQP